MGELLAVLHAHRSLPNRTQLRPSLDVTTSPAIIASAQPGAPLASGLALPHFLTVHGEIISRTLSQSYREFVTLEYVYRLLKSFR
jgi:hypothetical protein